MQLSKEDQNMTYDNMFSLETNTIFQNILTLEEAL
jgi:hypothetical protein